MRGWSAKTWQIPCKMEGEHGQMYSSKCHAKCKVTMPKCSNYHAKYKVTMPECSKYHATCSKLSQIQGKWYQERKQKNNQNLSQTKFSKTILKPFQEWHILPTPFAVIGVLLLIESRNLPRFWCPAGAASSPNPPTLVLSTAKTHGFCAAKVLILDPMRFEFTEMMESFQLHCLLMLSWQ